MDTQQRIAFVQSQVISAQVELEAMKAANHDAMVEGLPLPHTASDFRELDRQFMIGHNDVIAYLQEL